MIGIIQFPLVLFPNEYVFSSVIFQIRAHISYFSTRFMQFAEFYAKWFNANMNETWIFN